MSYKSRTQKEAERPAYAPQNALSFAQSAEKERVAGNMNRSVLLYDYALNFTIDALNECLRQETCDTEAVRQLYGNAIFYAQSCGRERKAEHLQASSDRWERKQVREHEAQTD